MFKYLISIFTADCLRHPIQIGESRKVSLIAGMEYGMERWNGKWNGTVSVHSLQLTCVDGTVLQG